MTYCDYAPGHPVHGPYHDHDYGFPLETDAELFERLVLEINQAGLSWLTILNKRPRFHEAYDGFDIDIVAGYGPRDRARLLSDPGIIRNRLKVEAAIENARRLRRIRDEYGGFSLWLGAHHPLDREEWRALFKRTFVFTGGEIVNEFLLSTGWLPGAHVPSCEAYARVLQANPPWMHSPNAAPEEQ